ncbi:MAG TPA: TraB/GumN family protein [Calditrichia bacterium]|nr:TraB/GumN family protein [Calditrichota bacterium]HQU70973.1 TraB/GumN family protein [Calditrichia bacterium]HQV32447.1 TraB/GumN family protein [Calditrichia bacterium]
MSATQVDRSSYPQEVRIVTLGEREFILVGTAHISQESADLVRRVIENEKPDQVCVELDQQRYKALSEQRKWESLDLKALIRQKQLSTLMVNLLLASYQKKLGNKLGVMPGLELLEATRVAGENNIPISLCDRDIRITLRRAWKSMKFMDRVKLLASGLAGLTEDQEISEAQLAELRQKDVLNELIQEMGKAMPVLKTVLIDERDSYLAQKIRETEGKRIVAVVGAGHLTGIVETLEAGLQQDLQKIEQIPPSGPMLKIIGWGIPAIIIGSLIYIGFTQGGEAAGDNFMFWFLVNGIPSAIGALVAWAHPLTIITAFLAAPFTSLTPVIGAGYVAAFVQVYFQPPIVREFQTVSDDAGTLKTWWENRLLRVFLVFILTSLGSMVGTYVGLAEIVTNLFRG